jgi:hypothetical protein
VNFGLARIRPRSNGLSPRTRGWESTATCGSCWRRPERSGIAKAVACISGHCERSRRQSWQPPPSSGSYAAGGRGQMSSPLSLLCPPISPTHRPTRRLRSPLPASSSQRCPRASVQRGHADGGYEAVLGGPLPPPTCSPGCSSASVAQSSSRNAALVRAEAGCVPLIGGRSRVRQVSGRELAVNASPGYGDS